jgi:hypothetical protein
MCNSCKVCVTSTFIYLSSRYGYVCFIRKIHYSGSEIIELYTKPGHSTKSMDRTRKTTKNSSFVRNIWLLSVNVDLDWDKRYKRKKVFCCLILFHSRPNSVSSTNAKNKSQTFWASRLQWTMRFLLTMTKRNSSSFRTVLYHSPSQKVRIKEGQSFKKHNMKLRQKFEIGKYILLGLIKNLETHTSFCTNLATSHPESYEAAIIENSSLHIIQYIQST